MKIKKLEEGMRGMFVDGTIVAISEARTINTRNGPRSVADATLEDKTGRIKLSLWEDMIEKVSIGDEVTISGAYVKEFRGELQLNISRSGRLETQENRISMWIENVKGWISEDIENFREEASDGVRRKSEKDTLYDWVSAKNLTVEELAVSKLPDDHLLRIYTNFASKANLRYEATYYTRTAEAHGRKHPWLYGRLGEQQKGKTGTEEDFDHVVRIFAGEADLAKPHVVEAPHREEERLWSLGGFRFDLKEDPNQSNVAGFFVKNGMHFTEVFAEAGFKEVPKQVYQDSGLPPEKLSYRQARKYIDDDEYEQYVMNNAIDRLLRSFVYAANKYRGGEEGFLYFIEDSGVIPKGIEWMIGEANRWPSSVVKRKVREMGEAYRQVIEEMGLGDVPEDTKTFLGLYLFPAPGQT